MELKWLDDFIILARLGNFSEAAKVRNVTQPAFSRRIKALEQWLGAELFDRLTTPVQLTENGILFLPQATQLATGMYDVRKEFTEISDRQDRTLRILTLHTLANAFIPQMIAVTRARELPIKFQITPDVKGIGNHVVQLLRDDADILIAYETQETDIHYGEDEALQKILLGHDALVPIIHSELLDNFQRQSSNVADWPIPYLSYARYSYSFALVKPVVSRLNWCLEPVYESSLGESLFHMAINKGGLAWVPLSMAAAHITQGTLVKLGSAHEEIPITVVAYGRPEKFSAAANIFWERIEAQAPFDFSAQVFD